MANIIAIEENGRAFRLNGNLQFSSDVGELYAGERLHLDLNRLHLAWLDNQLLCELDIPGLPYGDLVFARQQQDLFVALEFLHVANVFAVDPHARIPIDLRIALKVHFAHNFAALGGEVRCADQEQRQREQTRRSLEVPPFKHDAPSRSGREFILTRMWRRSPSKTTLNELMRGQHYADETE